VLTIRILISNRLKTQAFSQKIDCRFIKNKFISVRKKSRCTFVAMKTKLSLFASGTGTNAEVLMHYFNKHPKIEIVLVITNNPSAGVIERAKTFNIPVQVFPNEAFQTGKSVLDKLEASKIDIIILAGFLRKIPSEIIQAFNNKIINIHPALLPKFGGKGMYGHYVHEAVKEMGETETGITIHLVDEKFDNGKHIAQFSCPVLPTDTPLDIAKNVQFLEHQYFAVTIECFLLS
jgi:phosphoribosylglycinamide formyltransferase 1